MVGNPTFDITFLEGNVTAALSRLDPYQVMPELNWSPAIRCGRSLVLLGHEITWSFLSFLDGPQPVLWSWVKAGARPSKSTCSPAYCDQGRFRSRQGSTVEAAALIYTVNRSLESRCQNKLLQNSIKHTQTCITQGKGTNQASLWEENPSFAMQKAPQLVRDVFKRWP